jgi:hypothetical protein
MKYILIGLFLIPTICYCQKIVQNEKDKFNKGHRLKTSDVKLKYGLHSYLRTVSFEDPKLNYCYLTLFGFGKGAQVIGEDEKAVFLLDNDSTITVYSTGLQSYEISKYDNRFTHQYKMEESDLSAFAEHNIKSIRKYGTDSYVDFDIIESNAKDFKKAAQLILKELEKL